MTTVGIAVARDALPAQRDVAGAQVEGVHFVADPGKAQRAFAGPAAEVEQALAGRMEIAAHAFIERPVRVPGPAFLPFHGRERDFPGLLQAAIGFVVFPLPSLALGELRSGHSRVVFAGRAGCGRTGLLRRVLLGRHPLTP